jgi:DNA-binding response OmpR family regulator
MKKILVAETLKTSMADDTGVLARNDIAITYASTAEEILSLHRADKADLIIVDLDTPESAGDRLCCMIRKENELRAVSIIVVCDCSEEVTKRCMAFGANAVVHKPAHPKELLEKIKELLDIRERKVVREIVKISVTVHSAGDFFFAVAKNLSASGLLFETNRVISKGSRVSCSFVLQHQIVAQGEIARVNRIRGRSGDSFEYGVRFSNLNPAAESEIRDYFKNRNGK